MSVIQASLLNRSGLPKCPQNILTRIPSGGISAVSLRFAHHQRGKMHILSTTPFKSRKLKCLPAKEEIAMDFQNSEGSEADGIAPSTSEGESSTLEAESTTNSVQKLDKVEEGPSVGIREEEEQNVKKKMSLSFYLAAFWAVFWRKVKSLWASEWLSWLPLWRQNKLERLLAEADANPKDASKQSALLAELNKHRFGLIAGSIASSTSHRKLTSKSV